MLPSPLEAVVRIIRFHPGMKRGMSAALLVWIVLKTIKRKDQYLQQLLQCK